MMMINKFNIIMKLKMDKSMTNMKMILKMTIIWIYK